MSRLLHTALWLALPVLLPACTQPNPIIGHGMNQNDDYRVSHPIGVETGRHVLRAKADGRGRIEATQTQVTSFIVVYARRGHGQIEISGSPADVATMRKALISAGAHAREIVTGTSPETGFVTASFTSSRAILPECGFYTSDTDSLLATPWNRVSSEYGCTSQRNLGLMLVDPMDLRHARNQDIPLNSSASAGRVGDIETYAPPPPPEKTQTNGN